jgi:lysophospholipase L1-like esterase
MLNLVFLGYSLTEGVPHSHGDVDTYPFMVCQQFAASGPACTKIPYRGQTTGYLREKLDSWLFALLKPGAQNVLVLWASTNDLATGAGNVQTTFMNLLAMARLAHAAGWQVVVVDIIARDNYFTTPQLQAAFPANQAALNALILNSTEFDTVVDPAAILTDPTKANYYWDGTHLWPAGFQIISNLVAQAIRRLQGAA